MLDSRSSNASESLVDVHLMVGVAYRRLPQVKDHNLSPLLGQLEELQKSGQTLLRVSLQLTASQGRLWQINVLNLFL